MTHGFDLDDPLVCEGIVGDGCGGGRIFFVDENRLFVYDPTTAERMLLCDTFDSPVISVTKKGCKIFLKTKDFLLKFDLQKMSLEQ